MLLGEKIKQKRIENSISRTELAKRAGVSLRTLENWEYGISQPRSLKVLKVCEILDIKLDI